MDIEMIPNDTVEVVDDNEELTKDMEVINKGIYNVRQDITLNPNNISMYKDILEAQYDIELKDEDILEINYDSIFVYNEDINMDMLLEGLIDPSFKYLNNTNNVEEKNQSRFIVYILSSSSNNESLVARCINDLFNYPGRVLISLSRRDNINIFNEEELNQYITVAGIVESRGGKSFLTINDLTKYINERRI